MPGLDDPQIQIWLEQLGVDPVQEKDRALAASDVLTLFAYSPDWLIHEILNSEWFDGGDNPRFYDAAYKHVLARLSAHQPFPLVSACLDERGKDINAAQNEIEPGMQVGLFRPDEIEPSWDDMDSVLRQQGVQFGHPLSRWFIDFFLADEGALSKEGYKSWSLRFIDQETVDGPSLWEQSFLSPENYAKYLFSEIAPVQRWDTEGYAAPLYIWAIKDLNIHEDNYKNRSLRWARLMGELEIAGLTRDGTRIKYSNTAEYISVSAFNNLVCRARKGLRERKLRESSCSFAEAAFSGR